MESDTEMRPTKRLKVEVENEEDDQDPLPLLLLLPVEILVLILQLACDGNFDAALCIRSVCKTFWDFVNTHVMKTVKAKVPITNMPHAAALDESVLKFASRFPQVKLEGSFKFPEQKVLGLDKSLSKLHKIDMRADLSVCDFTPLKGIHTVHLEHFLLGKRTDFPFIAESKVVYLKGFGYHGHLPSFERGSLESVTLKNCPIDDISILENVSHYVRLSKVQVRDVSFLRLLYRVHLADCHFVTDVSPLATVSRLKLERLYSVTDVSQLGTVKYLSLRGLQSITSLQGLEEVKNLQVVYCCGITSLPAFRKASYIGLFRCLRLERFEEGIWHVDTLEIYDCPEIKSIAPLTVRGAIRHVFKITPHRSYLSLADISHIPVVIISLSWCQGLELDTAHHHFHTLCSWGIKRNGVVYRTRNGYAEKIALYPPYYPDCERCINKENVVFCY